MPFSVGAIEGSLRINIAQFQAGLRQAMEETRQKSRQLSDQLHVKARVEASGLTRGVAQLSRSSEQAMAALIARFRAGEEKAQTLGGSLQRLQRIGMEAFAQMGLAWGAAGVAQGFVRLITTAANLGDALNRLSIQTGISVENLSSLRLAAELNDASLEDLSQALRQMHVNLSQASRGSGEAAEILEQMGFKVQDLKQAASDPEGFLEQFAGRLFRIEDAGQRTEAMFRVFGRQATNLMPLLQDLSERGLKGFRAEAERLHLVLSQETARAMDEFNDNLGRMKLVAQSLAATLGGPLVQALNELAVALGLVSKTPLQASVGAVDEVITRLKTSQAELKRGLEFGGEGTGNWMMRQLLGARDPAKAQARLADVEGQLTALEKVRDQIANPPPTPKGPPIKLNLSDPGREKAAVDTLSDAWRALQAEHQRAQQAQQAAGELRLAQLQAERVGEVAILHEKQAQQQAASALEQTQLTAQAAWLKGHGQVFAEELKDVQARQAVLAIEGQIVALTTAEAVQRAQISRQLELSASRASLQDALLQRSLDSESQRLELEQIHIRMLDLAPALEQKLLTFVQAERQERQVLLELDRGRQKAAELAADVQSKLATAQADELAAITTAYATQQTAIDGSNARLMRQLEILQAVKQEAAALEKSAPFKAAAADLVGVIQDFQHSLTEGALDIASMVRNVGQTFIDLAMKPLMESLQKSLAKMLESISDKLGSWGGLAMAGIGVALTAVSTAFKDMGSKTESLGQTAADQIQRSSEHTRGLVAGTSTLPVAQISQSLSAAMRGSEALLRSIDSRLAAIAGNMGASQGAGAPPAYSYSISSETLGAARV